MEEKHIVNILWTGGLESTFRMVELSRKDCIVQPYYILFGRGGVKYELRAIRKITAILQRDKRTAATILPIIIVPRRESELAPDIIQAFEILRERTGFRSGQYRRFAHYARRKNLKFEMGITFSKNGTVARVLSPSVLVDCPDRDDVMMVDPEKGRQEWASFTLFENILFPKSLFQKDKSDEIAELKRWGYGKVLRHVWTCCDPIFGLPCGHCFPCKSASQEGAREMTSFWGHLFGSIRIPFRKIHSCLTRILRHLRPRYFRSEI